MAGDRLTFDYAKATAMSRTITARSNGVRETLNGIRTTFRPVVEQNWSGPSADAFVNLFNRSSAAIERHLDQFLASMGQLIRETEQAKREMEAAEKAIIDQATGSL